MSIEAEQALAASALVSAEAYEAIAEKLDVSDFHDQLIRLVYQSVDHFRSAGRNCDVISVGAILDKSDDWCYETTTPGVQYLQVISEYSRSYRAVDEYIRILLKRKASAKLASMANEIAAIARSDADADEKYLQALQASSDLVDQSDSSGFSDYETTLKDTLSEIVDLQKRGGAISGISTGFEDLDELLSGLNSGNLIIHAGRPGMGKSAFAINVANYVACDGPVYMFSLEMQKNEIVQRSLSSLSTINLSDIRKGRLSETHWKRLENATNQLSKRNLNIDDRSGLHVDQLAMQCRVAARKQKPALIVIDYLQLLRGEGQNRVQEIGYVSRALKTLAKELKTPVYCLAQLNRSLETRPDKRPMMSDLRDSGEIEQDADVIIFTYRDEVYNANSPHKGIAEVIVAKNRQGVIGKRYFDWSGPTQTFTERLEAVPEYKKSKPAAKLREVMGDQAF